MSSTTGTEAVSASVPPRAAGLGWPDPEVPTSSGLGWPDDAVPVVPEEVAP